MIRRHRFLLAGLCVFAACADGHTAEPTRRLIVAHRGLLRHAPETRSPTSVPASNFGLALSLTWKEPKTANWSAFTTAPLMHKADSNLIGYCGFVDIGGRPEMGWRLAAEYRRRGLATEAARTVLRFGVKTFGFNKVIATVQGENWASIRVVEKLGMTFERRISRAGPDVLIYAVESGNS